MHPRKLTVLEVIQSVFPYGTTPSRSIRSEGQVIQPARNEIEAWSQVPNAPADLFGVCAHLLVTASAVQWFVPANRENGPQYGQMLVYEDVEQWVAIGRDWKFHPGRKDSFQNDWTDLVQTFAANEVKTRDIPNEKSPEWWRTAYKLMIIADEACHGLTSLDYRKEGEVPDGWYEKFCRMAYFRSLRFSNPVVGDRSHGQISLNADTMCLYADRQLLCVQPKSRVPAVGCNVRVTSKNLALLPPSNTVRTSWQPSFSEGRSRSDSLLNLLVIPFPFIIHGSNFLPGQDFRDPDGNIQEWGWFHVKQNWLEGTRTNLFCDLVCELVLKAMQDSSVVHGIVLPELSLNWEAYDCLVSRILEDKQFAHIEFLVSGSSSNCAGWEGNFALSTEFYSVSDDSGGVHRQAVTVSRAKHHRWRLEKSQVETYALSASLDPRMLWWEGIDIYNREIKLNVFRQDSVFTTIICEDLARSDPCHEILRAMGPNLIFALLMDGPQLPTRWSARYATALADDPGSSVMTLTSQALLRRSNESAEYNPSWDVGLWKDDTGQLRSIRCGPTHQGILLTLSGNRGRDRTLCGRPNHDARSWRFHNQTPLGVYDQKYKEILE